MKTKTAYSIHRTVSECLADLQSNALFIKSGKHRGEVDLLQLRSLLQSHVHYVQERISDIDELIKIIESEV